MIATKTFADFGIEVPGGQHGEIDVICPACSPYRKPQHQRLRTLSVNTDTGVWHCAHCGWSGGLTGGKPPDWRDELPSGPRPPKVYEPPRPLPSIEAPSLWQNAVNWFAARGIPESVLHRNDIHAAEEYCPACDAVVGHVLFPYRRDGVHVNTKHRCGRKHFRMERGAERIFYGLDDVRNAETIYVVEGELDKLALEVAGFTTVLSVPDGAPTPETQHYASKFSFLASGEGHLLAAKRVILAADADAPGQRLTEELARRIGPERCSRVTWPDGIKDANEALLAVGADGLRHMLAEAEPYPVEGLIPVWDLARDLDDLYDNGTDRGATIGYPTLDTHYRVRPGLMTVLTGIPGHGKSQWLDQIMLRLAERHGWRFGICSPENQPLALHAAHLLRTWTGAPFFEGPNPRMSRDEMHAARNWLAEHFTFILPEAPTVEGILARAKILVYREGIKGLVVDPWNEIEHERPNGKTETEYISECLGRMRQFARHHEIHLWLVAHPTKLKKNDDGAEPVPGLWDISGSANWRNKADAGLTVWRDISNPAEPVQVHITKIRFQETGHEGMVRFEFNPVSGRYREVGS